MDAVGGTEGPSLEATLKMFSWAEYSVFAVMLGLSALIGVYYGCFKGENTVTEYMLGGKKMGVFPISLSLIASHVSGITLLGVPSEVYVYGTQYLAINFCNIFVSAMIIAFYLPVFYKLQLNSLYEYLEMRFNHTVRMIGSFLFAVALIIYIPVVIYVPALAFNQVTGMSIHMLTPIVCITCIFYTCLGGLKAVVWADALQSMFTFSSMVAVMVLGTISVGGFAKVFSENEKGGRLEMFNMDPNPFARNTFWTVTVGSSFTWLAHLAVHPGAIQRFIAVPTYSAAKQVVIWFAIGIIIVKSLAVMSGLIIYAKYHSCDPVITQVIHKPGQLLPYYVMDVAGDYPGLAGLFISGVVSAALSTMSAGLNTVAGTIYEDFIQPCLPFKLSDAKANLIMKVTVIILGAFSVMLVFIVEKLGAIVQMAISLGGITNGAMVFLFSFGIFFPWANTKGVISGTVASLAVMAWIVSGAQIAISTGHMQFPGKETSIEGCPANMTLPPGINGTRFGYRGVGTPVVADESVSLLYQISYMYFSTVGIIVGTVVGILISYMTGGQDLTKLNPELVTPVMRNFLPKKSPHPHDYSLVTAKPDNILLVFSNMLKEQ